MQHPHDDEVTVLYSENREALLRYAYRYMNDWECASDVLQTSMLKFIRMFDRLSRLTHQQKTGYLFTVVKHSAFRELEKQKRIVPAAEEWLSSLSEENAEDIAVGNLTLDEIRRCIAGLKPQYGDYIRMRYVDDLDDDSLDIDTEDTYCSEQIIGTNPAKLYIKRDKCSSSLVISLSNETLYIQGNLTEFEILKIANSVHSIF